VPWGELTLIDETGGRNLANRSQAPAAFLMVGLRKRGTEALHDQDDAPGVMAVTQGENGDRVGDM
jgi:hypothetical protein